MRTVVKSSEIGHLWAHQTQERARAGNLSFYGPAFYSYNTVIARIAKSKNNHKAYLITDYTYSVSTSSHQSIARSAIPANARIFCVPVRSHYAFSYPNVEDDHARTLSIWTDTIQDKIATAQTSREPMKSRVVLETVEAIRKAKEFASFFGVKWQAPKLPWNRKQIDAFMEYQARREADVAERRSARREQARIRREQADIKRREESAEAYASWLAGNNVDTWKFSQYHPTALRVIGNKVETSRGVDFPVSHAKRGLALVDAVVASGRPWRRNGQNCHLGHYQIDSIDPSGTVHAGCHVVTIEAINRIREQITREVA